MGRISQVQKRFPISRLPLRLPLLWLLALLLLGGCAARVPGHQVADGVTPLAAGRELPADQLLDVSIRVFEPGPLPDDPDQRRGLSPEIREAEARFVPIHLKYTMQRTGYWGRVRVVPDNDTGTDLLVRGSVDYSDGESLAVTVQALDARGRLWFSKQYAETARPAERERTEHDSRDIFQDLFNTIANDLAAFRTTLSPAEIKEIRQVAELRYAASMAPDSFSGYLMQEPSGRIRVRHLPARNDPMMERVRRLKARDDMLVDAINGYYDTYYMDLREPYNNWRKYRAEEVETMRDIEQQALTRQILGVASIVGAVALAVAGDAETAWRTSSLQNAMIVGGSAAIYSGYRKGQETEMNKAAIEELGQSFKSEAEPLVIEVDGETIRLSGSAEEQYARWRQILRAMYARETGLIPIHPNGEKDTP